MVASRHDKDEFISDGDNSLFFGHLAEEFGFRPTSLETNKTLRPRNTVSKTVPKRAEKVLMLYRGLQI